jgi:transposase
MIPQYIGIDLHKNYAMIAAVNGEQESLFNPIRVEMAQLPGWVETHVNQEDEVILEANTNAWPVVDLLRQQTEQVRVANTYKTKLIAEAQIKNDKVDALSLAKLLAARFVCDVWVPDETVRDSRALAAHRARLQKQATQTKNRLHGVVRRHNLRCPETSLFTAAGFAWLASLNLPLADTLQLEHLQDQLALLSAQIDIADKVIARQASQDPRVPRLMQITGIGYYSAFTALACIGRIQRFPSPDQLTAYAGLVPRQHQSGAHSYHGHITKAGNALLRWVMVEAAQTAIRWDPHWKQVYERIARRRGASIATVAVARKLLVVIWHMLTDQTPYFYLRPQTYVTKLQQWAYRIGRAHLPAASSREFVLNQLTLLNLPDLADSLTSLSRNGRLSVLPT